MKNNYIKLLLISSVCWFIIGLFFFWLSGWSFELKRGFELSYHAFHLLFLSLIMGMATAFLLFTTNIK